MRKLAVERNELASIGVSAVPNESWRDDGVDAADGTSQLRNSCDARPSASTASPRGLGTGTGMAAHARSLRDRGRSRPPGASLAEAEHPRHVESRAVDGRRAEACPMILVADSGGRVRRQHPQRSPGRPRTRRACSSACRPCNRRRTRFFAPPATPRCRSITVTSGADFRCAISWSSRVASRREARPSPGRCPG